MNRRSRGLRKIHQDALATDSRKAAAGCDHDTEGSPAPLQEYSTIDEAIDSTPIGITRRQLLKSLAVGAAGAVANVAEPHAVQAQGTNDSSVVVAAKVAPNPQLTQHLRGSAATATGNLFSKPNIKALQDWFPRNASNQPFCLWGRDPWSPILDATTTQVTPPEPVTPVVLRETRGCAAPTTIVLTSGGRFALDVTVPDRVTLTATDGSGDTISADVRVIGYIGASNRSYPDDPDAVSTQVAGPMFNAADLREVRQELANPTGNNVPFVGSIPPPQLVNGQTSGVLNWATIKDFPTIHFLQPYQSVVLWLSWDTANTPWFTTRRVYQGALSASSQNPGGTASINIQLTVEGRTSLFDFAVPDNMVWGFPVWRLARNDNGSSKAAYLRDLVTHGCRVHYGWDPEALNYGFRRIILGSYSFWTQVTPGTTHADPQGNGRYISPDEAMTWLSQNPTEFDTAIANWARNAGSLGVPYNQWVLEIWDEPQDGWAQIWARVARNVHGANPNIQITANPLGTATVEGTLSVIAPDVQEWRPQALMFFGTTDKVQYMLNTGKPVHYYMNLGGPYPKDEKQARSWYRALGWKSARFLNFIDGTKGGFGLWAYSEYALDPGNPKPPHTSDPWNDFDVTETDVALVYPGPFGPIPSRNWEAFRRSSEDLQMLRILAWRGVPSGPGSDLYARIVATDNGTTPFEDTRTWLINQLNP
jgi:hypothetical protein